jgi:HEAT repeat protein
MKQTFLIGLALVVLVGCSKKKEYTTPSLLDLLQDKDPKMRYYAARELGHSGAEAGAVVPALAEALKDEDKNVRMRAAYSLGEIGPGARPAISGLEGALKDPEAEVRKAADHALKKVRDPSPQGKDNATSGKHHHKRKVRKPQG